MMAQPSRQLQSTGRSLGCVFEIAKRPECSTGKTFADHLAIKADENFMTVIMMRRIKCRGFVEVLDCFDEPPCDHERRSDRAMGLHDQRSLIEVARQLQK